MVKFLSNKFCSEPVWALGLHQTDLFSENALRLMFRRSQVQISAGLLGYSAGYPDQDFFVAFLSLSRKMPWDKWQSSPSKCLCISYIYYMRCMLVSAFNAHYATIQI